MEHIATKVLHGNGTADGLPGDHDLVHDTSRVEEVRVKQPQGGVAC